ncbi:techylectin-5A-like [Artemia franciscana]|uniref:Fibrinogen C-terminal domain-containing protein n=1 Tax=Artemia franciscana TaxID=6661 RepID=A0AA88HT34_ARTSF|nr:hypothetical protein QYM36_009436 [Artemia franciscana]
MKWIPLFILTIFRGYDCDQHNAEMQGSSLEGRGDIVSSSSLKRMVRQVLIDALDSSDTGESRTGMNKTRPVLDFTDKFEVGESCYDIAINQEAQESGVYLIHPPNLIQGPWKVYCDMESEGGGWTVFQTRDDVEPHENFMRGWEDYKVGFGDFDREFWLGNILLYALTNVDNETKNELMIDLEDWSGNKRFARYRGFRIGSEKDLYRLYHHNLYFGNAGDSLYSHNGLPFSTFDTDNDRREGTFQERSCSRLYKGAWWYGNCHDSNLNGWYLGGSHRSFADGVNWYTWTGYHYSLKKTRMKFRPQTRGPISIGKDTYIIAGKSVRSIKNNLEMIDALELNNDGNTLTKP